MRIANREASSYAARREPFTNNNQTMYGEWIVPEAYTVFSYGDHYPMYVWSEGRWYENSDGYSSTTARHHSHARPCFDTIKLPTALMQKVSRMGYAAFVAWRLKGGKV